MDVFTAGALCVAVCIAAQIIKNNGEIKTALVLLCTATVVGSAAADILDIKEQISALLEKAELDELYLKVIFKGLGICYITKLSADCCRDNGQSALASSVEIIGKMSLIAVAMPLFKAVIEIVEALLL